MGAIVWVVAAVATIPAILSDRRRTRGLSVLACLVLSGAAIIMASPNGSDGDPADMPREPEGSSAAMPAAPPPSSSNDARLVTTASPAQQVMTATLRIGDCFDRVDGSKMELGRNETEVTRIDCSEPHVFEVVADGEGSSGGCYRKVHAMFHDVETVAEAVSNGDERSSTQLLWYFFRPAGSSSSGQGLCYVWRKAQVTGHLAE